MCSDIFTFASHWNDPCIPITEFCLYSKKIPTRESLHDYHNIISVKYEDTPHLLQKRKAIDTEESIYFHEWVRETFKNYLSLDQKCKESSQHLFLIGAIFE